MTSDVGTASVPRVSVFTLTAMVVGSMVGAGVFSLPGRFAQETGALGAITAWAIAGTGTLMLAFVFQRLAMRKPDLDAGGYAYAKAGFGEYTGFIAAAGYWASACIGNVVYWVLIMSTLGQWIPALGDGGTIPAIALSSAGLWLFFFMVQRGTGRAASINRVVTVAKVVPILVFIVLAVSIFDWDTFVGNMHGAEYTGSFFNQVRSTMLAMVFVFLGVEGASVYSRYARRREDVGRATVLGFLTVLSIFASVTIVSYGTMPMADIAALNQPSMAGILNEAVGPWGSGFVSAGLIITVLGAYLAWTLMAAEVLYMASRGGDMPRFLSKLNHRQAPVNALLLSSSLAQVVLILTCFSTDAFDFALDMSAVMTLIPFFLAALYAFKIRLRNETYETENQRIRRNDLIVASLAVAYTGFLVVAAGPHLLLISFIFYAPVSILFILTRKEAGKRPFTWGELAAFAMITALAVGAIVSLSAGWVVL